MEIKGKKVTIIGLARSGIAAARLLSKVGANVWVTEQKDKGIEFGINSLRDIADIKIETGRHTKDFIKGSNLIVASPGVREDAMPIVWARQENIPIISEIELGYLFCPAKIIAVTGSNGKTTVVTLITTILNSAGIKAYALGNIGSAFCDKVLDLSNSDTVVLEVSTFQLEWIDKFMPYIAVLTNISRNHLDRHKNMESYIELKRRIFINQTSKDFAVLNRNDLVVRESANKTKAKILYFSQGGFNANEAAAAEVASLFNISKKQCADVFRNFKGVEHRLEYVATINGVDFINDAKSTTVNATIWALNNIKRPIILIAGGRDKGADFKQLRPFIKNRLKHIVLFGEAQELISNTLKDLISITKVDSLTSAVEAASNVASGGECILLSPMCTSFDMFSDFEERGRVFKNIVCQKTKCECEKPAETYL